MTAEVAILNKSAVALAADSKVSIGGSRTEKTYDTQNKIFTLSKAHPVGILIYNNADFMGYPWETIIKLYRTQKRDKSERTVEDWAGDFIRFLKSFGQIKKSDITKNVAEVLISVFDEIESLARYYAQLQGIPTTSKAYEDALAEIIEARIDEIGSGGRLLSSARSLSVLKTFEKQLLGIIAHFVPTPGNKKLLDLAVELGVRSLIDNYFSPVSTGFAIAGFGSAEIFPSMAHYETDGYIGTQIKISKPDVTNITKEMKSTVAAFAQHDIAHRFMEGIDPDYSDYLHGAIGTAIIESNLKVFNKWAPKLKQNDKTRAAVRRAAERQFKRLHDSAIEYRRSQFWLPTIQMVAILPKDEPSLLLS
jgi:hypothetical protein